MARPAESLVGPSRPAVRSASSMATALRSAATVLLLFVAAAAIVALSASPSSSLAEKGSAGAEVSAAATPKATAIVAALPSAPMAAVASESLGTVSSSDTPVQAPEASIPKMVDEIKTLQAEQAKESQDRRSALMKALASKDGGNGSERAWRVQKSQYEAAALKDIEKGQAMSTSKETHMALHGEAAKMFAKYDKQAEDLMGLRELHHLVNETTVAEAKRSQEEKRALVALRAANKELRNVETSERKQQHLRHQEKQDEAETSTQNQIDKSVARQLSRPSDFSTLEDEGKEMDLERQSEQVRQLAASRDGEEERKAQAAAAKEISLPYVSDYSKAMQVERERAAVFKKNLEAIRAKDMAAREARRLQLSGDAKAVVHAAATAAPQKGAGGHALEKSIREREHARHARISEAAEAREDKKLENVALAHDRKVEDQRAAEEAPPKMLAKLHKVAKPANAAMGQSWPVAAGARAARAPEVAETGASASALEQARRKEVDAIIDGR